MWHTTWQCKNLLYWKKIWENKGETRGVGKRLIPTSGKAIINYFWFCSTYFTTVLEITVTVLGTHT